MRNKKRDRHEVGLDSKNEPKYKKRKNNVVGRQDLQ